MERRKLGRTGLEVSILGLGGLFISNIGETRQNATRAVRRAFELGFNYVDTAPAYFNSEEVLGEALRDANQPFILSTKLGGPPHSWDPKSKDALLRSVDNSLQLLHRDQIDILYIHEPDRPGMYDWWSDYNNFYGPVVEVIEDLKARELIRFSGLGGSTAYEIVHIMASGQFDVVLTAFNFNVLMREATISLLPEARRQNIGVVIGSPFYQGALATRYDQEVNSGARWLSPPRREQFKRLYRLLDDISMPMHELALRFLVSSSEVHSILVGAKSDREVEANADAVAKGPLEKSLLDEVNKIAEMVPFRPFEEPTGFLTLPFGRDYKGPPGIPGLDRLFENRSA